MAGSNERGRALEYKIAIEIGNFLREELQLDVISSNSTKQLNFRDKLYFDELDEETKNDFSLCVATFVKWFAKQDWLKGALTVTIDRFGDDKAKSADQTDIRLGITNENGKLIFKNFSVKNRHDALKHPRLPSLAQQCGIPKESNVDISYRGHYEAIWESFGKKVNSLNKNIDTFEQLDKINPKFRVKYLYIPLMENAVDFLIKHSKKLECAHSLFQYLVGKTDYIVAKNESRNVLIKHFSKIDLPASFSVTYPYTEGEIDSQSYFLLEFDNGWKIRVRIHNASGRIFKESGKVFATEKMDPICINLGKVIPIEKMPKKLTS